MAEKTLELLEKISQATESQTKLLAQLIQAMSGNTPPGAYSMGRLVGVAQNEMGQLVPAPGVEVTEDWLVMDFTAILAAGAPGAISAPAVTIGGAGHFDLVKITFTSTSPLFDFRIQAGDADKYLSQGGAWIPAVCMAGTAQLPYMILGKRRFTAKETITVEMRDQSTALNTVHLVFHGIRVFV